MALSQSLLLVGVDALLPDVRRLGSYNRPGTVTVLSADGQVIQKLGPATREKLMSGQMPLLVQRAFIAAEDRRFYQHDGIDPVGIGRAMVRNLKQGSVEEGASTITQQLARTVFLSQDRTILRKLNEVFLAGKLERQLSKQQILEQYLNDVYLGSSAYGISDAAWIYFSKTPAQLSLPEAALIAGLPPAPSVYSPLVNPDLALERRATVLRRGSDNAELVVPNQTFFTTATTTYTRSDRMRRAEISLSLSRTWEPQQIIDLLNGIAEAHPQVMAFPAPSTKLQSFGPELYGYKLSFSVPDPLMAGGVTADLRLEIVKRFSSLGIDPPV